MLKWKTFYPTLPNICSEEGLIPNHPEVSLSFTLLNKYTNKS